MRTLRQFGNFWILWLATIFLACSSDVVAAQISYEVTDLGAPRNDHTSCAMTLNNRGWTATQNYNTVAGKPDGLTKLLNGRDAIVIDGTQIDLGTLGGDNSFMNWGEINDRGQIVGYSETDALDPNGEDVCGFGTNKMCLPFLWQNFHIEALPTLGGNNGQASAINNRGQIVGTAETAVTDSRCPAHVASLPVLWEKGKPQSLPTVDNDSDGEAFWINDLGQAVGQTSNCSNATTHAVSWKNDTRHSASALPDYKTGAVAWGNNDRGQIVGSVGSPDGSTQYAALWQNGTLTSFKPLPGDAGAIASGINNRGQMVGSTWDSKLDWAHAVIWQDGVMTDLNTLFASSTLVATMANKINERGQIAAMAIVRSGPDAGNVHAILLTPVYGFIGRSVADDEPVHPKSSVPANASQFLHRFRLNRIGHSISGDAANRSSISGDSISGDAANRSSISGDSISGDSANRNSISGDSISGDSVNRNSISGDSVKTNSINGDF
jgi:probable HAF family extracellular repeat protein